MKTIAAPLFALLAFAAGATQAASPFTHPAIANAAEPLSAYAQNRDASPVLIGHPASPRWVAVHANHEHPAVLQARLAGQGGIDANTFLVQPPASVQWTLGPAREQATALVKP
jgi:hypothetical protein